MMSDLAILGAGGVTLPIFPGQAPDTLKYQLEITKTRYVICLDKDAVVDGSVLKDCYFCFGEAPHGYLGSVQRWDLEPCSESETDWTSTWEVLNRDLEPNDCATIIFTSGSTGCPKGVPLSHVNLISQIDGARQTFPLHGDRDRALSFLPLAHVFERMVTYFYLYRKVPIYFCESPQRLSQRMKEVCPTVMTAVPRLLEKVQSSMVSRLQSKPTPLKEIGRWALSLALFHPPEKDRPLLSWYAADRMVFSKFREGLGGQLKMLIVGGAPLSARLAKFFNNIGVPTFQGYGMTECSPVITCNHPGLNRSGTVGKPFPHVEVKIDPITSEVLARGPGVMEGYYKSDERVVDEGGWMHTGDQGKIDDDGFLTITGRIKELLKTSNGKYISPVPIEQAVTQHPWVDQAMVVAEGRPYPTILLTADLEQMPEEQGLLMGSDRMDEGHGFSSIAEHLEQVNSSLNPWEKIQHFAWLPKALCVEDGELTPTMKIRRHVVAQKFNKEIEQLYNEDNT
jgi:long-chain acyl-CoA synthetase